MHYITQNMAEVHTVLFKSDLGRTSFLVRINLPNILESLKQINVFVPVSTVSKFSRNTKAFTTRVLFHLFLFPSVLHPAPSSIIPVGPAKGMYRTDPIY